MHRTAGQSSRPRAFTLVEVLCVVTILGIISAVVIPQLSSRDDLKTSAAARVVVSQLQWAQNRAITSQSPTYVVINGQTLALAMRAGTTLRTLSHPVTHQPFQINFATDASLQGVNLSGVQFGTSGVIVFDELGSPYGANSTGGSLVPLATAATVDLVAGVQRLTIRVEPFTGTVSVN